MASRIVDAVTRSIVHRNLTVALEAAPTVAPVSGRILYAEDNRINQVVGTGAARKLGFEVTLADDGRGAVAARAVDDFAAILMDVMMPNVDGFEATRQIRRFEEERVLARIPIIGLSARAMAGDRDVALAAGMTDYLTKPLRPAELRSTLERWVNPLSLALAEQRSPLR